MMLDFYESLFLPLGKEWRVVYMLLRIAALILSGSCVWFMFRHWQRNKHLWQLWFLVAANIMAFTYYMMRITGGRFESTLPSELQLLLSTAVILLELGLILVVDKLIVTQMQRNAERSKRSGMTIKLRESRHKH